MCPARRQFSISFPAHRSLKPGTCLLEEKKKYVPVRTSTYSVLGPNSKLDSEAPTRDVRHGAWSKSRGYTLEISTAPSNPEVGIEVRRFVQRSHLNRSSLAHNKHFFITAGLDLGR